MAWKMAICEKGHPEGTPHERGGDGCTNSCTFATEEEAEAAGVELLSRWLAPAHSFAREAKPGEGEVNHRFNFETGRPEATRGGFGS